LLEVPTRTVIQVLQDAARRYGDAAALHQPSESGYLTLSWKQYLQAVTEIAAGLRVLGIAKGDVVALNSETRLEFYLADIGIMANGSIAAALYPSYPAKDLLRNIEMSGASAAFVETPKMLAAIRSASVRHWILLTGTAEGALTLEELRAQGRAALAGDPQMAARMTAGVAPADPAILYLRRHGRPQNGAGHAPSPRFQPGHGARRAADRSPRFHRGVSPLGPHCAAGGD
jgi:long-chain acyl-CoA synthetase